MYWKLIKTHIRDFAQDTRGTIMVETVLSLPLLIMGLAAMFEFFEIHRFQSARDKATYTIADMISREQNEFATLPAMNDGDELILVESEALYKTIFDVGFNENRLVSTRVFTSIRFAPQMCFDACEDES